MVLFGQGYASKYFSIVLKRVIGQEIIGADHIPPEKWSGGQI
jgi:hypothetical protein